MVQKNQILHAELLGIGTRQEEKGRLEVRTKGPKARDLTGEWLCARNRAPNSVDSRGRRTDKCRTSVDDCYILLVSADIDILTIHGDS